MDSASMKWPYIEGFWALTLRDMVGLCLTFHQRFSLIIEKQWFQNFSKVIILAEMWCTQSLHFWSKLGLMLPPRKPNTLLKIKFSAKANVLNFICYITSFSFWLFVALDFTIKKPSIKRSQLRLAPLFQKPSLRASCWWKKFCCSSFQTLVSFFTLSDSLCWL